MGVLHDLNMQEADLGALSRDLPERPPEQRRPPARTAATNERLRRVRAERTQRRITRIENLREEDSPEELAVQLGVPAAVVREASEQLSRGRPLRPEVLHALGERFKRRARSCADVGLTRPLAKDAEEMAELLEGLGEGLHTA